MSSDVAAQSRCHSTFGDGIEDLLLGEWLGQGTEGAEFFGHGQVDFGIRAPPPEMAMILVERFLATEFENRFEAFFLRHHEIGDDQSTEDSASNWRPILPLEASIIFVAAALEVRAAVVRFRRRLVHRQ